MQLAAYNYHAVSLQRYIADTFSNNILPPIIEFMNTEYGADFPGRVRLAYPSPANPVFNQPAATPAGGDPSSRQEQEPKSKTAPAQRDGSSE